MHDVLHVAFKHCGLCIHAEFLAGVVELDKLPELNDDERKSRFDSIHKMGPPFARDVAADASAGGRRKTDYSKEKRD